jgi:poly(A) polymerase
MDLPITDIDIATTALPETVLRLAEEAGLGVAATGLKHGTVTVIVDHHPFEVTTLRRDVETHGRHATVEFTDDWSADARRRDFTMNALYCDARGVVHDPLGGYGDLMARRVRFIGDAADRIQEDYLRILRFFRFTAQYSEDRADADGLAACTRLRDGLRKLSRERIHQEMSRLLVARRACALIETMRDHGILQEVLPAAPRLGVMMRIAEIERRLGLVRDGMLRLAALTVEIAEDASRVGRFLKVSREERGVLDLGGLANSRLASPPLGQAARALLYRAGPRNYPRLLMLSWARALDASIDDDCWSEAFSLPACWTAPKLPVDGADVMARGIPAGPPVGKALRALEDWWIDQDFAPTRDELLARIDVA